MMNKRAIFCLAFFVHTISAAPNMVIGLEGGYTYNELKTGSGNNVSPFHYPWEGMLFGIPVLVPLHEHFAFGSGLRYIQKNYYYKGNSYPTYFNGFLQVPVFVDFSVSKNKWLMFLDFGATPGFWLHSIMMVDLGSTYLNIYDKNKDEIVNLTKVIKFDSKKDNRFEAALFAGLGLRYVERLVSSFVSVQYHYGLTDLQKKNYAILQVPRYNNTVSVQAGFLFGRLK